MLKPALLYKDILEKKFIEYFYTDEYFFYSGCSTCREPQIIIHQDNCYQWAIVNNKEQVIGYLSYTIQVETDTVFNFGLYSFDKGNIIIGKDVFEKMEELIKDHRRIEWRMLAGNPAKRSYDRFCKKHNGNYVHLHKVCKDTHGIYHDEYIYEIVKE